MSGLGNWEGFMRGRLIFFFVIGIIHHVAGQRHMFHGYIMDDITGEKLVNAHIFEKATGKGSVSDINGYFTLPVSSGDHTFNISYIGYQPLKLKLDVSSDTTIQVKLIKNSNLDEVNVYANEFSSELAKTQMSSFQVPIKEVGLLPSVLGETDIIKTIQFSPGVKSGSEGSLGYYVRGGGPDQNLVILDGVPLYNISHLFGLYSIFNTDMVNSVTLYKGGFPARYGGRLSSVLNIGIKEAGLYEYHGNVSTGLIFSKFNLEGPVKKGKIGFNISARRTYADLIYGLVKNKENPPQNTGSVFFSDFDAKINFRFSEKSTVYLNVFRAVDDALVKLTDSYQIDDKPWEDFTDISVNWDNFAAYLKWGHYFTPDFSMNAMTSFSKYSYNISHDYYAENQNKSRLNSISFNYMSDISDLLLSLDFNLKTHSNHLFRFGTNITGQENNPGIKAVENDIVDNQSNYSVTENMAKPVQGYVFFEDDWEISEKFKTNYGLHLSVYNVNRTWYSSLEPRVSVNFRASDKLSVKSSFAKMNQYIHLLTTTTIRSPIDLWVPSTEKVKPEKSLQTALGIFYDAKGIGEISVEGFYKKMHGVIEYKEGATFLGSTQDWEDKTEAGNGWSYGAEFLFKKTKGKTSGWLGYTLSWSERKFENINNGVSFPFRYDNRHDLSFVATHRLNNRTDVGITWVYSSGNAVTLPTGKFLASGNPYAETDLADPVYFNTRNSYRLGVVNYYESRNNYRMPAYHRLDFSVNFHKQKKYGLRTWKVGLYNAYNNKNPYFLYLGYDKSQTETVTAPDGSQAHNSRKVLKQFSLLPVLPAISYNFKF